MSALPSVDIIIAARNEERHLAATLQALKEQRYPASLVTIYVVDDRSSDNTATIATDYGVQLLTTTSVSGVSAARNLALQKSNADLVGFLDAHCLTAPDWIELLSQRLITDEQIGGCQGSFDYQCTAAGAARFLRYTQFASDDALFEHTVSGQRSAFPWAVTGNSMFRRQAIAAAGGFDEQIQRCEDADFSWKVVLSGYRLEFVPAARVLHIDDSSGLEFLVKHFRYGIGAAQLAHAYNLHGRRSQGPGSSSRGKEWAAALLKVMYSCGYHLEHLRLEKALGQRPQLRDLGQLSGNAALMRSPFFWSESQYLRLSARTVFWYDRHGHVLVVDPQHANRIAFEGTAGEIFRFLQEGLSRQDCLLRLARKYDVSEEEIVGDIDDLVRELVELSIIERVKSEQSF